MPLIGHEAAWAAWHDAQADARMHHAWLLAGAKGLGKMQFALAAAADLVASTTDPRSHPDIHILERLPKDEKEEKKRAEGKPFETKRNIPVAQIRSMQRRLETRPTLGDRRAIVIDAADDLEKGASNALLKSLEEPPAGTIFFLVSHNAARLLPTIRSRCRVLRFRSVPATELRQLLAREAADANSETIEAAMIAAAGSPGAALDFVRKDLGSVYMAMKQIVEQGDPDSTRREAMIARIGARPDREKIGATLELACAVLAGEVPNADSSSLAAIHAAYRQVVALAEQAPTYNFDAALLLARLGDLLASASPHRDRVDV
ncbi:DNA polymerase III subunit delta' [Qipengyuania sp. JC766]|uniref:DNA polymerase III subunit delta' n=1 Tax=Qipengyuania sp. JC766 TaxID=3232139 RepID=UPI00345A72B7